LKVKASRFPGAALLTMFLLPACRPGTAAMPSPPAQKNPRAATEILASRDLDLPLDRERATVAVDVPGGLPEARGKRLGLSLDGVDLGRAGVYYEVYANLPPGAELRPAGPHYLGTLSSFGPKGGGSTGVSLDLTNLVRALAAEGSWSGRLTLTFVRTGLLPPPGRPQVGTAPKAVPRLKRVRIVRE
jgi:hypothetical protein